MNAGENFFKIFVDLFFYHGKNNASEIAKANMSAVQASLGAANQPQAALLPSLQKSQLEQAMRTVIKPPKERSGVYLLKRRGNVVYVGQSSDVLCRLVGHKDKPYDEVEIRWMPYHEVSFLEEELIKRYDPIFNSALKNRDELGIEINRLRKSKSISLRRLSRALFISAPYLSDMERGGRKMSETMFSKAKAALNRIKP